jgi:tRNA (cytidine/uridine-2'-O-)-methyltransferase
MRLALYQPDMPPNTGAMMRLAVCLGIGLDIIEPCGFVLDDRKLKRVGMDYIELLDYKRHQDWAAFKSQVGQQRVVLLTTRAMTPYHHFGFHKDDILMVGRESAGVPLDVHQSVNAKVKIPMREHARSLNVAMAAAIVLAEALRQTESFA